MSRTAAKGITGVDIARIFR